MYVVGAKNNLFFPQGSKVVRIGQNWAAEFRHRPFVIGGWGTPSPPPTISIPGPHGSGDIRNVRNLAVEAPPDCAAVYENWGHISCGSSGVWHTFSWNGWWVKGGDHSGPCVACTTWFGPAPVTFQPPTPFSEWGVKLKNKNEAGPGCWGCVASSLHSWGDHLQRLQ